MDQFRTDMRVFAVCTIVVLGLGFITSEICATSMICNSNVTRLQVAGLELRIDRLQPSLAQIKAEVQTAQQTSDDDQLVNYLRGFNFSDGNLEWLRRNGHLAEEARSYGWRDIWYSTGSGARYRAR